jgi:phosphoribosyl-ATP pyrophosphohydrolase
MAKSIKNDPNAPGTPVKAATAKKPARKKPARKKAVGKKPAAKKTKLAGVKKRLASALLPPSLLNPPLASAEGGSGAEVLDRLHAVVAGRKGADPSVSHSARLLSRGTAKIAQKFGEEAVECLIEAVAGNRRELIGESADVLYHLLVMWVDAGVAPGEVWAELQRREGISGIAEKAARPQKAAMAFELGTTKIP